ncbi:hypothetical protein ACJ72_00863 [Emergomyces africanus]|uniref:Uncharacterized protein n=1 Tax=Emergomyces africanus TaxID=1955775 RepID=A0A1B7P6X7_9EURO|nr:hypothetical protein ACJ72_00863 [Emergomyces africanus]
MPKELFLISAINPPHSHEPHAALFLSRLTDLSSNIIFVTGSVAHVLGLRLPFGYCGVVSDIFRKFSGITQVERLSTYMCILDARPWVIEEFREFGLTTFVLRNGTRPSMES